LGRGRGFGGAWQASWEAGAAGYLTMAAHERPRTTKLYDRTNDAVSLDEVERVVF
jgi:hypothetical protein